MNGQYYTFEGMSYILQNAVPQPPPVTFQGVAAQGSASVSVSGNVPALSAGQLITSPLFPTGTYIVDPDGPSQTVLMSQPATGSTPSGQTSTFTAGNDYTLGLPLTIHLLTGAVPLASNVQFSALTEANYDGYQPQQAVGPIVVNTPPPRQFACAQFERMTFQPSDYNVANSITGHCWTISPPGSTQPVVLALESYASPIPLQQVGDLLTLNPTLSLAFDNTAGVASPGIG